MRNLANKLLGASLMVAGGACYFGTGFIFLVGFLSPLQGQFSLDRNSSGSVTISDIFVLVGEVLDAMIFGFGRLVVGALSEWSGEYGENIRLFFEIEAGSEGFLMKALYVLLLMIGYGLFQEGASIGDYGRKVWNGNADQKDG
jgi:hypothetical protein